MGVHVCMCALLVSEWFDRFYSYSVYKILSVLGRCPVIMNIPSPKIGALQMDPKNQNGYFLGNVSNNLD
jgi:hypothetical protein